MEREESRRDMRKAEVVALGTEEAANEPRDTEFMDLKDVASVGKAAAPDGHEE